MERLDYACPYCYIGEVRLKKAIANIPGGEECGLDADEIREVLVTDQYQDEVILDEREAARYGIHAVPFFAIGQYGISGAQSVEGLEAAIKEVLKEQKEAWFCD